jgi:hypothetical protein
VLKQKPDDPISALASQLIESANKSYPVFECFAARKVYLANSLTNSTLQISVHLNYQGRSGVRHIHTFAFDESQIDNFPWDNPDDRTGLNKAINLINDDLSEKLRGCVMHSSIQADNKLCDIATKLDGDEYQYKNIIKACSEALTYAVAKCFAPVNIFEGFVQSFYPRDEDVEGTRNTKLLVNVLGGGKGTTSLVKFSKFYLIIDAASAANPYKIMTYY